MCQTILGLGDTMGHGPWTEVKGSDKFSDNSFTVR